MVMCGKLERKIPTRVDDVKTNILKSEAYKASMC